MKKRMVSLLLAAVMVFAILPGMGMGVQAAEGSWMWPAPGCHIVSSNFGNRDLNGDGAMDDTHKGIDIIGASATFGQPVVAAKSGTVHAYCNAYGDTQKLYTSDMTSFGNYVIINHGDGTYSIYAHMKQGGIKTGGSVAQGEVIGYIGDSGHSYGSHLHFQIFKDPTSLGRVVLNPMPTNSNIRINNTYSLPGGWPSERINYIFSSGGTSSHDPQGCVDEITGGDGKVYIRGWTFDRDELSKYLEIHVYIGGPAGSGEGHGGIIANQSRPDVNAAYPGVGDNHGFAEWITTEKRGTQEVYVYGVNTGGGTNVELGRGTVTIGESAVNLDVNSYIDGNHIWDAIGYGTFDVYINGEKVANDVNDWCQLYPAGTNFVVNDIKAASGYVNRSQSAYSGTISGDADVHVDLIFETKKTQYTNSILLNGKPISFDQAPVNINGRILVPVRAILEAMGASVNWDKYAKKVTATRNGTTVELIIDQLYLSQRQNGILAKWAMDVAAKIINGRTLIPARAVAEAFGCKVDWDPQNRNVIITT